MTYLEEKITEIMYCENCNSSGKVTAPRGRISSGNIKCPKCGYKLSIFKPIPKFK